MILEKEVDFENKIYFQFASIFEKWQDKIERRK